jgi:hypothetical protein
MYSCTNGWTNHVTLFAAMKLVSLYNGEWHRWTKRWCKSRNVIHPLGVVRRGDIYEEALSYTT